jgi:hypothetical protein
MSLIWNYFTLSGRVAFCKSCDFKKEYPPHTPTTYLIAHLQHKHKNLHKEFVANKSKKAAEQQTLKRYVIEQLNLILLFIQSFLHMHNKFAN